MCGLGEWYKARRKDMLLMGDVSVTFPKHLFGTYIGQVWWVFRGSFLASNDVRVESWGGAN